MYTFSDMDRYDLKTLRDIRAKLRGRLSEEIHKRQAIKAEILFLQKEIKKYEDEQL